MQDHTEAEATEATLKDHIADLEEAVNELPELPTPEEAELGELARIPEGQFKQCELVGEQSGELCEFITDKVALPTPKGSSDEEVRRAVEREERTILEQIEAEVEAVTGGDDR